MLRNLVLVAALSSVGLSADIRTTERTKVEMPGMPGIVKTFGGSSMKGEGQQQQHILQGRQMMTITDGKNGTHIDLDAKRVCEVEMDKQRYRCTTFAEYAERMQKAQEAFSGLSGGDARDRPDAPPAQEMEIKMDINKTGERSNVNGVDCERTVLTVNVVDKATGDPRMKLVNTMWLGPDVPAKAEQLKFMEEFRREIGLDDLNVNLGAMMSAYPQMKEMMEKSRENAEALDGMPYRTISEVYNYAPQGQAGQQEQPSIKDALGGSFKKGLGGLRGGFGRKNKDPEPEPTPAPQVAQGPAVEKLITRTETNVLEVTTNVAPGAAGLPAGFKERK